MAAIEIRGFEGLVRDTERFSKDIARKALLAAENAAAEVVRLELVRVAPRGKRVRRRKSRGWLRIAQSIIIYEARAVARGVLSGVGRRRLLVGPSKYAPHAFWREKGWTSAGPRRRARRATQTTHSQSGVTGGKRVRARPWAKPAAERIEPAAFEAGSKAFRDVVEMETRKLG